MKAKKHSIPVFEHRGIMIRENRPGYFMVDLMRDGKRERACFNDIEKAKGHCDRIADKLRTEGTDTLILKPAQREDAIKALRELKGKASLQSAAKFWMKHFGGEEGVTVAELGRRWLAALQKQECRPATMIERGHKVARLSADLGDRILASVTRDDLAGWLESKGLTGETWAGYRRAYRAMLQFAIEEGLIEFNVATAIRPLHLDEKLPTPFTVESVRAIMQTAEKWAPAMVPVLAVQFFGGLRPIEALGLLWTDLDFKRKIIRIRPEITKVRRARIIEKLNPVLFDWLLPYRKPSGAIGVTTPSQYNYFLFRKPIGAPYEQDGIPIAKRPEDKRPRGIAKAAGVEWIADGPRKTFATMFFAQHGDAGKLAGILGHTSGVDILYKHYRGLATKADARRYWKIRPASSNKVVIGNFKRAAG